MKRVYINPEDTFDKGFISVSGGHKLYYERFGNPNGKPVLFLHGGPGGGFGDKDKRFFDPKIWQVIFFDQRGAGRSTPFASIQNNTTDNLIEDINILLNKWSIKKVLLFGGSWGSTLALTFAITHPEKVSGMILRGIFLSTKKDIDHLLHGGIKNFFPEVWDRFIKLVPRNERKNVAKYYLSQMQSPDENIREKYTFEWSYYEASIMKIKTSHKRVLKDMENFSYKSLSILEAHYIANYCFLPENKLIKNLVKIKHIPTAIVHGRYDFVCRPSTAFFLHKKLKMSRLHLVPAGHSSSENEIEKKLLIELKKFSKTN